MTEAEVLAVLDAAGLRVIQREPRRYGVRLVIVMEISEGGRRVGPVHFGLQELSPEHTGAGRWTGHASFRTDPAPLSTCHAELQTTAAAVLARWLMFVEQSAQLWEGECGLNTRG